MITLGVAWVLRFTGPITGTFSLEDWRTALEMSLSGQAHGKLLLLP